MAQGDQKPTSFQTLADLTAGFVDPNPKKSGKARSGRNIAKILIELDKETNDTSIRSAAQNLASVLKDFQDQKMTEAEFTSVIKRERTNLLNQQASADRTKAEQALRKRDQLENKLASKKGQFYTSKDNSGNEVRYKITGTKVDEHGKPVLIVDFPFGNQEVTLEEKDLEKSIKKEPLKEKAAEKKTESKKEAAEVEAAEEEEEAEEKPEETKEPEATERQSPAPTAATTLGATIGTAAIAGASAGAVTAAEQKEQKPSAVDERISKLQSREKTTEIKKKETPQEQKKHYEAYISQRRELERQEKENLSERVGNNNKISQLQKDLNSAEFAEDDKKRYTQALAEIEQLPEAERSTEREYIERRLTEANERISSLDSIRKDLADAQRKNEILLNQNDEIRTARAELEKTKLQSEFPNAASGSISLGSTGVSLVGSAAETALGGTASVSAAVAGGGAAAAAAQLQQLQQQISNTIASLENEQSLDDANVQKYEAQLADLRRDISKLNLREPSQESRDQYQQLTNLQRDLRGARAASKSNPQALQQFQSSLPGIRAQMALPDAIITAIPGSAAPATAVGVPLTAAVTPEAAITPAIVSPLPTAPTGAAPSIQGVAIPKAPPRPTPRPRPGIPTGTFGAAVRPATGPGGLVGIGLRGNAGPKPARPLPQMTPAAITSALDAAQQEARRSASPLAGDTQMPDTTLGEDGGRGSVLDVGLKQPSYAFSEPAVGPPIAGAEKGGGAMTSVGKEAERMRHLSEEQTRTLEALAPKPSGAGTVAAAAVPAIVSAAGATIRPSPTAVRTAAPIEEQTEDEAEDEAEQAAAIDAERQQAQQDEEEANLAAQANAKKIRDNTKKKIVDYIKGGNASVSVETLAISLLINLVIMNIQGINGYIFKSELIPKQSLPEDFCCVTCDLFFCMSWPLGPPCFLGPLFLIIGVVAYFMGQIPGISSLLK